MIQKQLAGPVSVCVKFSTLQEYGVDRVFFLENGNVDTSQRNIVFLARGEKAKEVLSVAGTWPSQAQDCRRPQSKLSLSIMLTSPRANQANTKRVTTGS